MVSLSSKPSPYPMLTQTYRVLWSKQITKTKQGISRSAYFLLASFCVEIYLYNFTHQLHFCNCGSIQSFVIIMFRNYISYVPLDNYCVHFSDSGQFRFDIIDGEIFCFNNIYRGYPVKNAVVFYFEQHLAAYVLSHMILTRPNLCASRKTNRRGRQPCFSYIRTGSLNFGRKRKMESCVQERVSKQNQRLS